MKLRILMLSLGFGLIGSVSFAGDRVGSGGDAIDKNQYIEEPKNFKGIDDDANGMINDWRLDRLGKGQSGSPGYRRKGGEESMYMMKSPMDFVLVDFGENCRKSFEDNEMYPEKNSEKNSERNSKRKFMKHSSIEDEMDTIRRLSKKMPDGEPFPIVSKFALVKEHLVKKFSDNKGHARAMSEEQLAKLKSPICKCAAEDAMDGENPRNVIVHDAKKQVISKGDILLKDEKTGNTRSLTAEDLTCSTM